MPSKERVSFAQLKVGILGIVALTCIALLVFLLTGDSRGLRSRCRCISILRMPRLDARLSCSINGIQAGKVTGVVLSGETDPTKVIKIDLKITKT